MKVAHIFLLSLCCMIIVTVGATAVYAQPAATGIDRFPSEIEQGMSTKIFLDLRDINVVDVLKFLALEGDLNIVTSKNVQGRSTLLLKNVSIEDSLDIIAVSNQLAIDVRGRIIYIMTEDEYRRLYGENYNDQRKILVRTLRYAKPAYVLSTLQSVQSALGKIIIDEETGSVVMIDTAEKISAMDKLLEDMERKVKTEVVQLRYAKAEDLVSQLQARVDAKQVGSVTADTRSNQIVVSAYPDRMEEILPLIKSLDTKTEAVSIQVRLLQVTINPKYDVGISWEKTFSRQDETTIRNTSFSGEFPISSTNIGSSSGTFTIGALTQDEFTITLQHLKQVSKTKILANPSLTVLNGQEAKINIGDRVPYVVSTTTGTGTNVTVSEEIVFIDVGIQLVVTPNINKDGFVTMNIRPEISSQTGTLTTPQEAEIPIVNTTFLESSVIVKDGHTVVMGGLRRDDLSENDKGIPYLMDIPLIGSVFKSRAESTMKSEILILITPQIVSGEEHFNDNVPGLKPMRAKKLPNAPMPSGKYAS